ncbi:hypothetical protein Clacol_010400 [Clathrus columnatus]|uniref:Cytochrome P450 n=1 Tax=Clathrus columnatus TaxID=1419009 RepID=A0AAV5AW49_9AGAM|nr:hypothetical protein Clacol_010400 [Clathrus columnatus]
MNTIQTFLVSLSVLSLAFYWLKIRVRVPKGYKLPPGPPSRFLIGNLTDIPLRKEWETYHKWSETYGDLTYLNVFGTSILLVNSYKSVAELFDQSGTLYAGRFKSTMLIDLVDFNWSLAMMQPNELWRQHRSILHQYLNKASMMQYRAVFENSAKLLSLNITYWGANEFPKITYGIKTIPENDPYIELAERVLKLFGEVAAPGACLVDIIPILKYVPDWFPGAGFKQKAKILNAELNAMAIIPFAAAKDAMKAGKAPPSIVGTALDEIECKESNRTEEERNIQAVAGIIYMAAIDTTESVLQTFYMAMLLYPELQKKAQAELDEVVGGDKLPTFDDRKDLPYIEAIIKEVLRWHPTLPVAFPHMLMEDDKIGEYFVPKGTIVMGNAWSLLHSKLVYGDDVAEFNPERFMKPNVRYPDNAFGFGRRICPGRQMADNMLFIMIASVLHTFDITPYQTLTGVELPSPDDAFVSGIIS